MTDRSDDARRHAMLDDITLAGLALNMATSLWFGAPVLRIIVMFVLAGLLVFRLSFVPHQ